jgi:GT2 family glycosyltransferase
VNDTQAKVRVIVVNYNGGSMTIDCLRAILHSDWPPNAMELVLVDNASTDGIATRVGTELPAIEVIRSDTNLGFGGAVNLGLHGLTPSTEYVGLVNNDAIVSPGWLRPLARTLASDSRTGAACPKVVLADEYEELRISGSPVRPAWSDRRRVTARVVGARVDGDDVLPRVRFGRGFFGPEFTPPGQDPPFQWASGEARLLVPAVPGSVTRELCLAAPRRIPVVLRTERAERVVNVDATPTWLTLPEPGKPFDVINNVGSELGPGGYFRDRGYLERDEGQYDRAEEVFAWYGGAVLLPASYIQSVGLFDERLFSYYEDAELAWRGRRAGWHYVTVPESVVRHRHMATSAANAPLTLYFNERNRLLVLGWYSPRSAMLRMVVRFVAITLSYLQRDVVARVLSGRRPSWTIVSARWHALLDCLRLWGGRPSQPARPLPVKDRPAP